MLPYSQLFTRSLCLLLFWVWIDSIEPIIYHHYSVFELSCFWITNASRIIWIFTKLEQIVFFQKDSEEILQKLSDTTSLQKRWDNTTCCTTFSHMLVQQKCWKCCVVWGFLEMPYVGAGFYLPHVGFLNCIIFASTRYMYMYRVTRKFGDKDFMLQNFFNNIKLQSNGFKW